MLYNEFLRLKYHVKTKACFILLFFYMVLLSVLLVEAIPQMVILYNSVGLTYKIESFFFLWFGYHRFISISAFRLLFFLTRFFPFVFLPLLLSWSGGDTFSTDSINECGFLLYLRTSRKKYFIKKLFTVFIESFITVFMMLTPVVIAVSSSVLTAELTNNIPMDLAFYDSGLMTPNMEIYWYTVMMFLMAAVILTWVKIRMEETQ